MSHGLADRAQRQPPAVTDERADAPGARIRRRVLINGHVQAVGFRASCGRRAIAAGVGGWVRNLADGRVEAAFEGPPVVVDELLAWCHQGPPLAHVTHVDVLAEQPQGDAHFTIR